MRFLTIPSVYKRSKCHATNIYSLIGQTAENLHLQLYKEIGVLSKESSQSSYTLSRLNIDSFACKGISVFSSIQMFKTRKAINVCNVMQ